MTSSENRLLLLGEGVTVTSQSDVSYQLRLDDILQTDVKEVKSIYGEFAKAQIETESQLPTYAILWKILSMSNTNGEMNLTVPVLIYRYLEEFVSENEITRIETEGVSRLVQMVILDLSANEDISTDIEPPNKRWMNVLGYLRCVLGILPFILDQVYSYVFVRTPSENVDITFAPKGGRMDEIRDVASKVESEFTIVDTGMTLASYFSSNIRSNRDHDDIRPVHSYVKLNDVTAQLRYAFSGFREEIFGNQYLETAIYEHIETVFGYELNHTTWWVTRKIYTPRVLRALMYYFTYTRIIEETDCDKIVINSLGPMGRAILAAGAANDVENYHIPHSVVTGNSGPPPFGTTQFLAGTDEKRYVEEELGYVEDTSNLHVVGRPYLSNLYARRDEYMTDKREDRSDIQIVVATQPLRDTIREGLIEAVLSGVSRLDLDVSIVIKTHPSEDPAFYRRFAAEHDAVRIESERLFEILGASDLTVTVNSNVGLESQILGTPCVIFNKWPAWRWDMAYIRMGPVPVFHSESAFVDFMSSLDTSRLDEMAREQYEFAIESYTLDSHSSTRIAEILDGVPTEASTTNPEATHSSERIRS